MDNANDKVKKRTVGTKEFIKSIKSIVEAAVLHNERVCILGDLNATTLTSLKNKNKLESQRKLFV